MTKTGRAADVPEPTNRPTVLSVSNSETQNVQLALSGGQPVMAALDVKTQPTVNVRHHIRRERRERKEDEEGVTALDPGG